MGLVKEREHLVINLSSSIHSSYLIHDILDRFVSIERSNPMRYIKSQMKELMKDNRELQIRLKEIMDELGLERTYALKALYHAEVAEGGKYQQAYQALDKPKD